MSVSVHDEALPFGRRVRRPEGGRIPVTIFTGFLGAGKTSLIKRLIETPEGAGSAIIVNEIGEIGIDQAILGTGGENVVLLGNGCLCCTVRTDLQEAIRSLAVDRARGLTRFRRIIVETSGLADPGPVLQTFISDRALAREFHLRALIGVVDAYSYIGTVNDQGLAQKQIALSDRTVISKGDIVSPDHLSAVVGRVRHLTGGRPLSILNGGDVAPEFLLSEDLDLHARDGTGAGTSQEHGHAITSFALFLDAPVPWEAFVQVIRTLTQLRGRDVLRVKGIVSIAGCEGPVLVHAVQHLVHDPVELQHWPDEDHRSRLVFITRGIDRQQIADLFSATIRVAGC
jgi:G3E family GTPase